MASKFGISAPVEKLMLSMAAFEADDHDEILRFPSAVKRQPMAAMSRPGIEPPHEPTGSVVLVVFYATCEFYDDVSEAPLDHGTAIAVRKTEIEFFKSRGDCRKVQGYPWMTIISTKWVDQNKGDYLSPNHRCRLVGCEFATEKRDDLSAATPPLGEPESDPSDLRGPAGREATAPPHGPGRGQRVNSVILH